MNAHRSTLDSLLSQLPRVANAIVIDQDRANLSGAHDADLDFDLSLPLLPYQRAGVKLRGLKYGFALELQAQRRVPAQGDLVGGRSWLCRRGGERAGQWLRRMQRRHRGVADLRVQKPEKTGLHQLFFHGGAQ